MLLTRGQSQEALEALALLSRRMLLLRLSSVKDPSLQDGLAGLALAHAALDAVLPKRGHGAHAVHAMDRAIAAVAERALSPGLYGGFTGVAWTVEILSRTRVAPVAEDPNGPIDEALELYLRRSDWRDSYDLIDGLVGVGVYALERVPRPSAKRLVDLIVTHFGKTASRDDAGVTWQSDPRWLPRKYRRRRHADWNLGVAHGVPGVVALLGRIVASEIDPQTREKARDLLEPAVAWLLAQQLPPGLDGCFPYGIGIGISRQPTRLAWCYGDPGIAATLLLAARAVHNSGWEEVALRVALQAAARSERNSGVVDAGLCHGAVGVAHIFHRLFLSTGERRLAKAAQVWFGHALAMRRRRNCFGGFAAWAPDAKGKLGWQAEVGFLTGAAGVALALSAATLESPDPTWDRALLLS